MVRLDTETTTGRDSRPAGPLRAFYAACAVSALGDGMFAAGVPLAAAAVTRDPSAVAAVGAAEMLPWLIVTPFAGALVDRLPRRAVMVAADTVRAACLLVLTLLVLLGHGSVGVLAIVAALMMVGYMCHDAAAQGLLPVLVDRSADLHLLNGRLNTATTAGRGLIGPPLGSAAFAIAPALPFLADALSFAASAVLLRGRPAGPRPPAPGVRVSLLRSIREGADWLRRHRTLRLWWASVVLGNLGHSAATAVLVLYAQDVLHLAAGAYGLLLCVAAVGGILGGLLAGRLAAAVGEGNALALVSVLQAVAWLTIARTGSPVLAGAALAVSGAGIAVGSVIVISGRQRLTPPELLGRIVSTFRTFGVGALALGATLGGVLASAWGLTAPMWMAVGCLAAAALPARVSTRP